MDVTRAARIDRDQADALWRLYEAAFETLRRQAAAHLMDRAEFLDTMADARVQKHVVVEPDRGVVCGLGTITDDLTAYPAISPEFYAERWPDLARDRRIWYVGLLAVHPDQQGTGAVARLVESMCAAVSAARGGLIATDISEFNERTFHAPQAFGRLARVYLPGITRRRVDTHSYWAYELREPI